MVWTRVENEFVPYGLKVVNSAIIRVWVSGRPRTGRMD